jgi:hypothetical protein
LQGQVRVELKLGHPVDPGCHLRGRGVNVEVEDVPVRRKPDGLELVEPPFGKFGPEKMDQNIALKNGSKYSTKKWMKILH